MNDGYDYFAQCTDNGVSEDLLLEIVGRFLDEQELTGDFKVFCEEQLDDRGDPASHFQDDSSE